MESREMTDAEFEAGLRAVLGSHYTDLTGCRNNGPDRPRSRGWEWICWAAVYGALGILCRCIR